MISASRAQLFLETVHGLQSDVVTWRSSSGAWFLVSKNHLELDFHLGCVVIIVILFFDHGCFVKDSVFFSYAGQAGYSKSFSAGRG